MPEPTPKPKPTPDRRQPPGATIPAPGGGLPDPALWGSLGWLRFSLALIVAAAHLRAFYADSLSGLDPARIIGGFNGMAAVLGFLLVSGFSICHSLVQKPHGYVRRRFLRIYPMYLIGIVLTVMVSGYWVPGNGDSGARYFSESGGLQILANLFLLQGVVADPLGSNDLVWTLSLEWWLYMLAPLVVAWPRRRLGYLLGVLAFGYLSWMVAGRWIGYYTHTLGGLNLWFLGVFWFLGFWFYLNRDFKPAPWVMFALVWFLTGVNRESLANNYQVPLVLSCVVLVAGAKIPWPGGLNRLGRFMGDVSYPLYLIHLPVFALLYRLEALRYGWIMLILAVGASIAACALVEKPLRAATAWTWSKVAKR